MQIPNIACKITCYCPIYLSETPEKIEQALSNIFGDVEISIDENNAKFRSTNLEILKKIFETIRSRGNQNVYRRQLNSNLRDDSTWFYLNKQAAYANTVAICSEAEESPLGPIKVIIESTNIERIIEWLVSE